jgi:hypothetical protein
LLPDRYKIATNDRHPNIPFFAVRPAGRNIVHERAGIKLFFFFSALPKPSAFNFADENSFGTIPICAIISHNTETAHRVKIIS